MQANIHNPLTTYKEPRQTMLITFSPLNETANIPTNENQPRLFLMSSRIENNLYNYLGVHIQNAIVSVALVPRPLVDLSQPRTTTVAQCPQ